MRFRFRTSVKILPGVRLNFSRSGVTTTIGRRGATVRRRSTGEGVAIAAGLVLLIFAFATCGPDEGSPAYISPPLSTAAAPVEQTEGFYAHSALNVRAEPNENARVVRTLARGDYVQLGAKDGNGWAGLYTGGAREGYVYRESDAVRRNAPAARAPSPPKSLTSPRRSSARSRGYYTGPRGGCYTYSGSGRKRYVDRSMCD